MGGGGTGAQGRGALPHTGYRRPCAAQKHERPSRTGSACPRRVSQHSAQSSKVLRAKPTGAAAWCCNCGTGRTLLAAGSFVCVHNGGKSHWCRGARRGQAPHTGAVLCASMTSGAKLAVFPLALPPWLSRHCRSAPPVPEAKIRQHCGPRSRFRFAQAGGRPRGWRVIKQGRSFP